MSETLIYKACVTERSTWPGYRIERNLSRKEHCGALKSKAPQLGAKKQMSQVIADIAQTAKKQEDRVKMNMICTSIVCDDWGHQIASVAAGLTLV